MSFYVRKRPDGLFEEIFFDSHIINIKMVKDFRKLRVKSGIRDQEEQVYEGINDQRKSQSGR